jgi:hypothetical protein
MTHASAAQPEPPDRSIHKAANLTDTEHLRLHNLLLQRQVAQLELHRLTQDILQSERARSLQDRVDRFTADINAECQRLFFEHGVDPSTHQLNVERGIFVERALTE